MTTSATPALLVNTTGEPSVGEDPATMTTPPAPFFGASLDRLDHLAQRFDATCGRLDPIVEVLQRRRSYLRVLGSLVAWLVTAGVVLVTGGWTGVAAVVVRSVWSAAARRRRRPP